MNTNHVSITPTTPEARFYRIVPTVHSLSLKDLNGFNGCNSYTTLEFGAGLNILHGWSGSGRTRVFQAIMDRAGGRLLRPQARSIIDYKMLSPGQRVHALGISFLSHVPDDKCLLSDDVLDYLDQEHQRLLVEAMLDSGKQVVLTVRDSQMDRLTKALSSSEITTRMGVKWTRAFQLVKGGAG